MNGRTVVITTAQGKRVKITLLMPNALKMFGYLEDHVQDFKIGMP